ncbi:hypothetical protein BH09PAT2_BH09PAT2_04940 [soil metagenome]
MIDPLGFISAALFYLIPVLIGRPIVCLTPLRKFSIPYPFVGYFMVGSITLYFSALFIQYICLPFLPNTNFMVVYTGFCIVGIVLAAIGNIFAEKTDLKLQSMWLPLLLSILLSITAFVIWHIQSIYPFNWDIYEHQTLVNTILAGRFSFFTSHITDTFGFNGYSSIFHLLIATSQMATGTQIFPYWNSISLIHCSLLTLAAYLAAYEITKKPIVGILNMLFCVFFFDSVVSFSTLFFIPQTFTACIFAFAWLQLVVSWRKGELPSPFWIVCTAFFILMNHYVIGFAAVAIYLVTYLYFRNRTWIHTNIHILNILIIFATLGAILIAISPYIPLGFLNQGEGEAYTFSFSKKFEIMRQIYGYFFLFFMPLSAYIIFRSKHELDKLVLCLASGILIVVTAQLPYAIKFYVLGRQFAHIVLAIGIATILLYFPRIPRYIGLLFLFVTVCMIYILNSFFWKSNLQYHEYYAHISPFELDAATFLKNNYSNSNAILISDPATQHILEPFSGINTQGGAYANLDTRLHLHQIAADSERSDVKGIVSELGKIQDTVQPNAEKRLFVVSGRYFLWQYSNLEDKKSLSYNIWYPVDLTLQNRRFLLLLERYPQFFKKVYENQAITIFEINN